MVTLLAFMVKNLTVTVEITANLKVYLPETFSTRATAEVGKVWCHWIP